MFIYTIQDILAVIAGCVIAVIFIGMKIENWINRRKKNDRTKIS